MTVSHAVIIWVIEKVKTIHFLLFFKRVDILSSTGSFKSFLEQLASKGLDEDLGSVIAGFCLCLHLVCLLSRHIQDILCVLNLNHILSYYTYFKRSTINFFKSSNESVRSFTLFSIPAILRSCSLVCLNAGLMSSNIDSQASILARWASTLFIMS